MTNELTQTFAFEDSHIRIIVENGEPLFCASDVCKTLGYRNPSEALRKHCVEGGITKRETPTSSGFQSMAYLNEPNLYRLVARSKMPHAVKFQDWVFGEVLPTIRKTGSYGKAPALPNYAEALRQLADKVEQNAELKKQIEADAPKVSAYDALVDDKGLFTATAVAKVLNMNRNDFFTWAANNRAIYKQGKTWLPYATWVDKKWAQLKVTEGNNKTTGEAFSSQRLRFTAAGIFQIHKLMKAQNLKVPEQLDLEI